MSSYMEKFRNKKTGEIVEVSCLDDYFGKHHYGYVISDMPALTEEQFHREYEGASRD